MELIVLLFVYLLLFLVQLTLFLAFALALYGVLKTGVPYLPAPLGTKKALITSIDLKDGDVCYDLGSGDGKILFFLSKQFPNTEFVGVEKAPLPVIISWFRLKFSKQKNITFIYKDFLQVDLSKATHVFVYLLPSVMDSLLPYFEQKLEPGTKMISCDFKFSKKDPSKVVQFKSGIDRHTLYEYRF